MYRKLLDDLIYYHSSEQHANRFNNLIYSHEKADDLLIIGKNYKTFKISKIAKIISVGKYQNNLVETKKYLKKLSRYPKKDYVNCWFCETNSYIAKTQYPCCADCFSYCEFGCVESVIPLFHLKYQSNYVTYFLNKRILLLSFSNKFTIKLNFVGGKKEYAVNGLVNAVRPLYQQNLCLCICEKSFYCPYVCLFRLSKIYSKVFMYIDNFTLIDNDIMMLIKYLFVKLKMI